MDPSADPDVAGPFWVRLVARGFGVIGAVAMAVLGVTATISLSPTCIFAGALDIVIAAVVIAIEAPFLCTFVGFLGRWSAFWDRRPYWFKAGLFMILPIIPTALCTEATTILASLGVFLAGMVYGVLALGKKADRATMMRSATSSDDKNAFANQQISPAPTFTA